MAMVALVDGVCGYKLGEAIQFYLDPNRLFVFDDAGNLVAVPEGVADDRRDG